MASADPSGGRDPHTVIRSPRDTLLPFISRDAAGKLAYPPNLMPGQRDVVTPYGTIRVNEWGPESGRKVLLVHGDSTPSPLWAKVAHGISRRGCRVMTLDLWGRGYTDTPTNCVFDVRLYTSELLWAVASSPLSWTTGDGFSIVGFSLGGGISVDFAGTFPDFVNSIVTLCPASLLRSLPDGYNDPNLQKPEDAPSPTYIHDLVGQILGIELENPALLKYSDSQPFDKDSKPEPALSEEGWEPAECSMADLLQWQWDYHKGLVHAFSLTVKDGAIMEHYGIWKRLAEVLSGKISTRSRLRGQRVLVIFAAEDDVVVPSETKEDILKVVPAELVDFEEFPGGHGFIWPQSEALVERLARHWGLS